MNSDSYKSSKNFLGIKNLDIWCTILKISKDTDKSYSCGRLEIPYIVESQINTLIEKKAAKVLLLTEKLKNIFPTDSYTVNVDNINNDLVVLSEEFNFKLHLVNDGKDWFGHDVYKFKFKNIDNLILYYPCKPWLIKEGANLEKIEFDWFFYRAEPRLNDVNYVQNYHNELTRDLLSQCLGFKI